MNTHSIDITKGEVKGKGLANRLDDVVHIRVERGDDVRITATSPIPLFFSAGGDPPALIPHTVSAGILGEASQLLTGTTEADILAYYHVDFLEEKVYETVSKGYETTATWNLGGGTVHFDLKPTENKLSTPDVTSVTIISREEAKFTFTDIPSVPELTIRCNDPIYQLRTDGQWGGMCVAGIEFRDIDTLNNTAILPCCSTKAFEHDKGYMTQIAFHAPHYESSPNALVTFGEVPQLSPPTYEIQYISTNYAWVQMTCCIRECGDICGTHIPSPADEHDECSYEVEISEDGVNWRKAGQDMEELTPNTFYHVRVRTVDEPSHRCDASDWVTKSFTTLPQEPIVTVDIGASIAAGGIPEAIMTGRDEEFTFIVNNLSTTEIWVDVFLTFENHDIPRVYPHDLHGLIPGITPGAGYTLPGSGILVLNDAYVAIRPISIRAGESGTYTLKVFLPHDALPAGIKSAQYSIHTKVGVY